MNWDLQRRVSKLFSSGTKLLRLSLFSFFCFFFSLSLFSSFSSSAWIKLVDDAAFAHCSTSYERWSAHTQIFILDLLSCPDDRFRHRRRFPSTMMKIWPPLIWWIDSIGINFRRTNLNVYKNIFRVSNDRTRMSNEDERPSFSDAPKKVKDVVAILEKDPNWLAHKYNEVNICRIDVLFTFPSLSLFQQVDYQGFKQFLILFVDNSEIPDDLCRHLFLSFIKKPSPAVPFDPNSTIGALPLGTPAIPPTTTTTLSSMGATSTFPSSSGSTTTIPRMANEATERSSIGGFSFFRSKRATQYLVDDCATTGTSSTETKSRTGRSIRSERRKRRMMMIDCW